MEPKDVLAQRVVWQEDYCNKVINIITSKLQDLGPPLHKQVAQIFYDLAGGEASGIALNDEESRVKQTATCMVNHSAVTNSVEALIQLMYGDLDEPIIKSKIADIIDYLLPWHSLNQSPVL